VSQNCALSFESACKIVGVRILDNASALQTEEPLRVEGVFSLSVAVAAAVAAAAAAHDVDADVDADVGPVDAAVLPVDPGCG
jgi:hypothetical protein